MSVFSIGNDLLRDLQDQSIKSPRKRVNYNLHKDYSEPCQRLLNHITMSSYVPPHRHLIANKLETLIAVKGLFGFICFDSIGQLEDIRLLGTELYQAEFNNQIDIAIEIQPATWHTVVAIRQFSTLLEVKAGPFNPDSPKEIAEWAPNETDIKQSNDYLKNLKHHVSNYIEETTLSKRS